MSKALEFYKEYYGLDKFESPVDESTIKFFDKLETELLGDFLKFKNKLYVVTLTPERWELYTKWETQYQSKKEADKKAKEIDDKLKLMEEQAKEHPQKLDEKESFDFRELEVIR